MSQDFSERVVLVTGGSRGIGRAISVALGRAGAKVAINYVKDDAAAHSTLTDVENAGGSGGVYQADVANAPAVQEMAINVERTLGPIDMLVTSAGIAKAQNHRDLTFKQYRDIMATSVDGTFAPIMAV